MASSPPAPESAQSDSQNEQSTEYKLQILTEALEKLKERHAQIERDRQRQAELQQQLGHLSNQQAPSPEIEQDIKQIQQHLEELEFALESQLLSWDDFKEPFWQAVRFGGLGLVIGWFLKALAG